MTKISDVSYNSVDRVLVLQSSYFSGFEMSKTYCLLLKALIDPTSIRRLQIFGVSTNKQNRIYYEVNYGFTSLDLYSTKMDNTDSAMVITLPNPSFTPTTIMDKTVFALDLVFTCKVGEGKVLPTKENQVLIIVDLPNINVDKATATLETDPNLLVLSETPSIEIRTNRLVITNLGKDLVTDNAFTLKLGNLKVNEYKSDALSASVSLYWKNTNSLVSYYKLNLNKSITRYSLSNLSIKHINSFPFLYTLSTWPLEFTFSINKDIVNGSLQLKDTSGIFNYVASTCDFHMNKFSAQCSSPDGGSTLIISDITVFANTSYKVRVWVYLNSIGTHLNNVVTPSPTVQMLEETNVHNMTPSFKVKMGSLNQGANIGVANQCIRPNSPVNCVTPLVINENSGNFVLLESDSAARLNFDIFEIRKLGDFKNLWTNYFKLRFKYEYTSSSIAQSFAGDWTSNTNVKITDSQFIKGSHNIYFPQEYYEASSANNCRVAWASTAQVVSTDPGTPLNYSFQVSPGGAFTKYHNYIDEAGLTSTNTLKFLNYRTEDTNIFLTKSLFHHLVRSVTCNAAMDNCDTDNVNNAFSDQIILELTSNCYSYKKDYYFRSIFQSYDLIHEFSLDDSNALVDSWVRANRFVTLLPQPGVFSVASESSSVNAGKSNIFKNAFLFSGYADEALCIVELEFSTLTLTDTSNDDITLHTFFNGMNVIDFENMDNYPVNKHSLSVAKNALSINMPVPNILSKLGKGTSTSPIYYTNSSLSLYFGDDFKFKINPNQISATNNNKENIIIVPLKCSSVNNVRIAYSNILNNDISNSSSQEYSLSHSYDDSNNGKFYDEENIITGYGGNVVTLVAQWEHFVFEKNTKVTYTQKTNSANSYNEDSIKYMALLTKDNFTDDERLLGYNNVEIDTSRYIQLEAHNPFTINNYKFNYLMIKDRTGGNNFDMKGTNNKFKFAFQGVPVPVNPSTPVQKNDVAFFAAAFQGGSNNNNFILTNFDGTDYLVDVADKTERVNDAIVVKTIDYTTQNLKSGGGAITACGRVELVLLPSVIYFEVYSESFTPRTIPEGKGFDGSFIYNENMFKGKAPVFEDETVNNTIDISFCNIDVSANKRFKVTRVLFYFKDAITPYVDYTLTDTQVSLDIPNNNNYKSGSVVSYQFDNSRQSYGLLTLKVTLDHEVFRNMILTIEGDISGISADASITPFCTLSFGEQLHPHDILFETCSVDLPNNKITLTTFNNVIIHESTLKSFYVFINPVFITSLDNTEFTIRARFNDGSNTTFSLFAEEAKAIETNESGFTMDNFSPMLISDKMEFLGIQPTLPFIPGMMEFQINFFNDLEVKTFVKDNEIIVNELRLILPIGYYGAVPSDIRCYINEILIENCTSDFEMIFIRTTIDLTKNIRVGIFGYDIRSANQIDINKSVVLFTLANRKTFSRDVFFYGKTSVGEDFDRTLYPPASSTNIANLRIESQDLSNDNPGRSGDLTLKLQVDELGGIVNQTPFTLETVKDSIIYIILPKDIKFLNSNYYDDQQQNDLKPTIKVTGEHWDNEAMEPAIVSTPYEISGTTYLGNLIYAKIDTDQAINNFFRGFTVNVTGIEYPSDEGRIGLFTVYLVRGTSYTITNFPLLNTSVAPGTEEIDGDSMQKTLIKERQGLIEYYRGINFLYTTEKYYFELKYDSVLKPGIYGTVDITVKSKKTLANAFTTLTIYNQNNLIKSLFDSYDLDGRQNLTSKIFAGVSCGIFPGRYVLNFNTSNTDNFHNVPNIVYSVSEVSEKNRVKFYSDFTQGTGDEYNGTVDIIMGRGSFVNFWIKPIDINMESLEVYFTSRINEGTTVDPPVAVNVPGKNRDYLVAKFNSPDSSVSAVQYYNILIRNNDCFVPHIDRISFHPNLVMESFEEYEIQMADFIYQNSNTVLNLDGVDATVPYNVAKFYVNYDRGSVLPVPSNFYCALYCEDRDPLTVEEIKTNPSPSDKWYLNFFYRQIKTSDRFSMTFSNLVRDRRYTLQCYLETAEVEVEKRSTVMRIINTANNGEDIIEPAKTPILECIDFYVKNTTLNFHKKAADLVQEAYHQNFEENGCVLAVDTDRDFIKGYQNNSYDCDDTKAVNVFANDTVVFDESTNIVVERENNRRLGFLQGKELRFLQDNTDNTNTDGNTDGNTDTNTDNMNTDNTETTETTETTSTDETDTSTSGEDTDVAIERNVTGQYVRKYHRICLLQYPRCPTGISSISNVQTILNGLLNPPPEPVDGVKETKSRVLQDTTDNTDNTTDNTDNTDNTTDNTDDTTDNTDNTTDNTDNTTDTTETTETTEAEETTDPSLIVDTDERPSKFREQLTTEEKSNYEYYKIKKIDSDYDFSKANLKISYTSDFSITTENEVKYTTWNFEFEAVPDEITCWWSINSNTDIESTVTVKSILKCDSETNLVCGNTNGIEVPAKVAELIPVSRLNGKEYALWVTCRQNALIARDYSTPKLALRVTSYHEKALALETGTDGSVIIEEYVYECKKGNPLFPSCCLSKEADSDNTDICSSFFMKTAFAILAITFAL
eukprot:CAMPEP_0170515148 /NCGR_PEP_ID=MMETSP0209-20121228/1616_1 /TAXON_ID=665100 ORGANISM="Litonotus pictus, Strain P1" /NCGR_SAMPLE_ID=MMETSP0209 /ASSEMBLY_ACC=CAM_ASM_000301 /LENGTH=2534 /DNA_ID=CAMNT_0010799499 /DNA_START=276 /DNA_END=7877 /DNA_ORIENTATION=-